MKGTTEDIAIGAAVRVIPQHWLRGFQEGLIVDYQPNGLNRWLVRFSASYPGGGIDGDKLWLNESQFIEVKRAARAAGEIIGSTMQYREFAPDGNGNGDLGGKRTLPA